MLVTLLSAGVVLAGALALGQTALRLCGAQAFSWISGPVGLALMMLVSAPSLHVPGRGLTVAIGLLVVALAGAVWTLRDPAHRPPLSGLVAAAPLLLLVWVPFMAAGHAGTLGVALNNDMAAHLLLAEAYRDPLVEQVNGISGTYPIGPHALTAVLARGLGGGTDEVFAGLTAALPVLLGLTALAVRPRVGPLLGAALATLVGVPFLVAGYYGQGSFKELMQALFVLAFALQLRELRASRDVRRWIPLGLLVAGSLAVYSAQGALWPVAIFCAWLLVTAVAELVGGRLTRARVVAAVRGELLPLAVGVGATLVLLVPQASRILEFASDAASAGGTGIDRESLGNLAGPLPFWEALGIWDQGQYRLPANDPYGTGALAGIVLALALIGVIWCLRRGERALPAAAAACFAIWLFSDRTQSPYVAAKALVILSPLLLFLALWPLLENDWSPRAPRFWVLGAPVAAGLLVALGLSSSVAALRTGPVGPREHAEQLRELRPTLGRDPTLFLGNDDFARWELAGVPVAVAVFGGAVLPMRPEKAWAEGQPLDLDSVPVETLNSYRWIIVPRDAAGSEPPAELRLARSTRDYALYERVGTVPERSLLREGDAPGAVLDCRTPAGRALVASAGEAAVRGRPVSTGIAPIPAGGEAVARLDLGAGEWDLVASYTSPVALDVSGPGLEVTLPPNLDRPGPRLPIGRVKVTGPVELRLRAHEGLLTPPGTAAAPGAITAVPAASARIVPLAEACGQYVDWYR